MIKSFNDLAASLKAKGICKKMVVAWGVDSHTIEAASLASDEGYVKVTLVGDCDLIEAVCKEAGIDIEFQGEGVEEKGIDKKTGKVLIEVDPKYFRPAEVNYLL